MRAIARWKHPWGGPDCYAAIRRKSILVEPSGRFSEYGRYSEKLFLVQTQICGNYVVASWNEQDALDEFVDSRMGGVILADEPCPHAEGEECNCFFAGNYGKRVAETEIPYIYECRIEWDELAYRGSTLPHKWRHAYHGREPQTFRCGSGITPEPIRPYCWWIK